MTGFQGEYPTTANAPAETGDGMTLRLRRRREEKPALVNIAPGKQAKQSSLSRFSAPEGANAAVNGLFPDNLATRTEQETDPWWSVDLLDPYPIESIVIHNATDAGSRSRGDRLRVDASPDGRRWEMVHAGPSDFGARDDGEPLTVQLGARVLAQHLRITIEGNGQLALSQVEIFIRPGSASLKSFCVQHSLAYRTLFDRVDPFDFYPPYRVERTSSIAPDDFIGLSFEPTGRFGNNLLELSTALELARSFGVKYVRTADFELNGLREPAVFDDIVILPPDEPFPVEGHYLIGHFLYEEAFPGRLSELSEARRHDIVQRAILPHLDLDLATPGDDRELVVHIRSGDIFSDNIHPHYVQPPLAYYALITEMLQDEGMIDKVCIVFEDRLNPCVDAFEAWLSDRSIPCRMQSGTLAQDMATIVNASHVVFGTGTFGYGACLLTDRFASVFVYHRMRYDRIGNIDRLFWAEDIGGAYIKPGDWRNTDDQRRMMVDYPKGNVVLRANR